MQTREACRPTNYKQMTVIFIVLALYFAVKCSNKSILITSSWLYFLLILI